MLSTWACDRFSSALSRWPHHLYFCLIVDIQLFETFLCFLFRMYVLSIWWNKSHTRIEENNTIPVISLWLISGIVFLIHLLSFVIAFKQESLLSYIFMYFRAYPIESYPVKCKQAAAIMLMIMNNLDPKVAQFPHELVTYGGNGQVFSNWAQVYPLPAFPFLFLFWELPCK